jgi:hypothetical protein
MSSVIGAVFLAHHARIEGDCARTPSHDDGATFLAHHHMKGDYAVGRGGW